MPASCSSEALLKLVTVTSATRSVIDQFTTSLGQRDYIIENPVLGWLFDGTLGSNETDCNQISQANGQDDIPHECAVCRCTVFPCMEFLTGYLIHIIK